MNADQSAESRSPAQPEAANAHASNNGDVRILLVEDDADSGGAIRASLEGRGFAVTLATDADKAISLFAPDSFDAIVMDVRLPDMNGIDLLGKIRERDAEFPVILITAYLDLEPARKAVRLGASDFILKPFGSIEDVITPVERAVRRSRLLAENRALERQLMESEARCREFSELLPETVFEANADGILQFANIGGLQKFGRTMEELNAGKISIFDHVAENDIPRLRDTVARLFRGEKVSGEVFAARPKDGPEFHMMTFSTAITRDGKPVGMRSIAVDISEQKKAEAKIRTLTTDLMLAEERERRRLATEIHDGIAQSLALVHFEMDALAHEIPDARIAGALLGSCARIKQMMSQARLLMFELHPPLLHKLGLEATLKELVRRTKELYGLEIALEDDGQPKPLTEDTRTLLYRTVRELIVNTVKHAKARKAKIVLSRDKESIRIMVTNDGMGFDAAKKLAGLQTIDSYGLYSMREHLRAINGEIEIESQSGKEGMRAAVTAPIDAGKHEGAKP
jgi:PAS domain S-box-containing protein